MFLANDEMNTWQGISASSLKNVCVIFIAELGFVCVCVCVYVCWRASNFGVLNWPVYDSVKAFQQEGLCKMFC